MYRRLALASARSHRHAVNVHPSALDGACVRWRFGLTTCSFYVSHNQSTTYASSHSSRSAPPLVRQVLLLRVLKRPQTRSNDLHSLLFAPFPEVPFRLAERKLASPFLTSPTQLCLFETWPQQWGHTFLPLAKRLEKSPNKVRQECEQQQHEYPANPDEEVQRQLRRVDLFFVHALG